MEKIVLFWLKNRTNPMANKRWQSYDKLEFYIPTNLSMKNVFELRLIMYM